MKRISFIKKFGLFSIFVGLLYFILETWYHFKFGQPLIQLIGDYISIGLLIFSGVLVRKRPEGVGLLCGAWGFTFCINYRAFAWRMTEIMEGNSTTLIDNTTKVLVFCLIYSFVAFIISLMLCYPKRTDER